MSGENLCPTCGGSWDPVALLEGYNANRNAFEGAHRYIGCPSCRKRVSAAYDAVDAHLDTDEVAMVCGHCGHRFSVLRYPTTTAAPAGGEAP